MVAAMSLLIGHAAQAAVINYGNFSGPPLPPGISFQNVFESSGTDVVPLYGAPHKVGLPAGLDFDPTSFVAFSGGGGADITDGQLNFTVRGTVAPGGYAAINSISIFEGGDLSLSGTGTVAAQVQAGTIMQVKITEVDGNPIAPINVPVNSSIGRNLVANPGLVQPWSQTLSLNLDAVLTSAGVPFTKGVTAADVVVDNQLNAVSEPLSTALIAKKDFVISVDPEISGILPEPTSLAMAGLAMSLLLGRRRVA